MALDLTPKTIQFMGDTEKIIVDMNVTQMLRARRDEILEAIASRTAEPTVDLLFELGQLDDALGIAPLPVEWNDEH